jgi:hypothetical protein
MRALTGGGRVQRFAEGRRDEPDDDDEAGRERFAREVLAAMPDHFKKIGGAKAGEAFIRSVKAQSPSEFAETKALWRKHVQKHTEDRGLLPLVPERENLQRAAHEPEQENWPIGSKKPAPVNAGVAGGSSDPLGGDRDFAAAKGRGTLGGLVHERVKRFSERLANPERRRALAMVGLSESRLRAIIDKATPEQLEQLV